MPFVNKFKILVCMACLVLVGQGFAVEKWTDVAVQPGQDGGYYIINNEQELAWIALNTMNKESTYKIKLNADLNLKGKLWLPIGAGHGGNGFKGEFLGQGHSISNVYIKSDELLSAYNDNCLAQNLGFFGINGGGTIKDFNLKNVDIYATNSHINGCGNEISVGGLVGWKTPGGSVIEKVVVSGEIYTSGKGQGVGGLIGNAHSSRISNSVSMVNITADGDSAFVGGIVGLVKNNEVKIDSCVYAGNVLESNGNGGAVGAVAGRVYKSNANANMNEVYYDVDLFGEEPVGVVGPKGQGGKTTGEASPVPDLNNEEVICMLNKGTLDANGECDKQEPWSVGGQNISWNGSDGFKVTFDADGGTFPENSKTYKMLSNGNTITADEIALPTKDGAAFAGWSLSKGASEPAPDLGVATKPTRVYAVWNPIYTITFDANGGSFPDDGSLKKEKKVAKGDVITVEGIGNLPEFYCKVSSTFGCDVTMFFTGWSFKSNPSTESEIVDLNNLDVFASKDTTLYAVWTSVETYTVTFNAGGHGKTKVNFVRVGAGETITKTVDPSADIGYQFGGWFTEDSILFEFETTPITKSIILYAHWTPVDYTITYMLEDGTNDSENPETYNIETPTFEFAAPTREGYTFEKWYYDENFSSPATQITQGTTSGPKTLYAKWIPNIYTITYRAGSVGQGTVLPSEKEHGKPINLKLINDGFTRNGYTQTGWTTTDGGEKEYESGASYTGNHDLTLFPTWSDPIVYKISYVCDGCADNTGNRTSYTVETSTFSVTFTKITPPEGYKMVGWYSATDYITKVQQIKKGAYGDTTLYAKLNKIYKITYVGTDKPYCDTLYTVDDAITLRNPADSAGYTFGGWFTNANFEGDVVTGIVKGSTGDTTFYAKWVPVPYTITYNIDGEPAELTPNTYTAAEATELATPTRDGYEFDGWYSNVEFNGDKVASIAAGTTGDTTFFAKWTAVEYTATYDVNGGSMDGDVSFTFTIESGELTLATPNAREGFTFDGWLDSKTGSVLTGTFPANSFGERTLIAQWTPVLSTITVTAKSQVFEYDGKAHSAECEVTTENPWGYTFTASSDEQVTDVKDDEVTANCSVVVKDGDEDITALFDGSIEYVPGTISVKAKVVNYGGIAVTTDEDGTTAEIDDEAKLQIDIPSDVTVDHVTFNRNFPLVKYSTVVLPFSIDTNKVHGADFYSVSMLKQNGKWVAGASEVKTSQLIANTPYLLFAREANLTFDGPVTFNTSEMHDSTTIHEAEGCSWTFKGTYTKHVWGEGDPELGKVYAFSAHDVSDDIKIGKFTKFGKDAWIRPMRAYLIYESLPSSDPEPNHAPAPMSASAFKSMSSMASIENSDVPEWIDVVIIGNEDEQTTPIARLNTQTGEVKMMNGWFDMKGRKLNGKPTVKGIYYNNGKRVIVK